MKQILQRIQIILNIFQKIPLKSGQKLTDKRKHLKGGLEGDQIAGVGCLIGDAAGQPFKVIDRLQIFTDFIPNHRHVCELLHGGQTLFDFIFIDERLFDDASEHSCAHGGLGAVQNAEKRSLFLFFPKRLHQFQISPGRAVEKHKTVGKIRGDGGHLLHVVLLRLIKVLEQRTGGDCAAAEIVKPQTLQGGNMEMLLQYFLAGIIIKIIVIERGDRDPESGPEILEIEAGHHQALIANDFGRHEFLNFILQLLRGVRLGYQALSGGNVRDGHAVAVGGTDDTHEIVVSGLVQLLLTDHGAGSDDPDDLTFYQAFGQLRVFHLFTDRDFVTQGNQFCDIGIRGVKGNAAHWGPFLQTAFLSGQRQFKFL